MTPWGETVGSLLSAARGCLSGGPAAPLEAEILLGHVLGRERAWLFANRDHVVQARQRNEFRELVGRRSAGEPIAYLTGTREFWSLALFVTPDVLVPRPETELLVTTALAFIPAEAAWRVADIGTGSGAVALAIAHERPSCEIHATDRSAAALAIAAKNVRALAPGRVHLHPGSWLQPLTGRFRVIVSNPPYVAADDPHLTAGDCRFEPREALTPGPDGMAAIRTIARQSIDRLEPGGLLAFEHGYDQGAASRALLRDLGYRRIVTASDLEGRERVTSGLRAESP